jgi:hypothetical protein
VSDKKVSGTFCAEHPKVQFLAKKYAAPFYRTILNAANESGLFWQGNRFRLYRHEWRSKQLINYWNGPIAIQHNITTGVMRHPDAFPKK